MILNEIKQNTQKASFQWVIDFMLLIQYQEQKIDFKTLQRKLREKKLSKLFVGMGELIQSDKKEWIPKSMIEKKNHILNRNASMPDHWESFIHSA